MSPKTSGNAGRNRLIREIGEAWLARDPKRTFGQVAWLARHGEQPWRKAIRKHPSIQTLTFAGFKAAYYRARKK